MAAGSKLTPAAVALHFPSASCFLLSLPPSLVHSLLFKALSPVCFHLHAPPLLSSSSIIFAVPCFHPCVAMVSVILPVDFVFHPFPLPLAVSSSVVFVCAESVVPSSSHPGGARATPGGRDRRRPAQPGPAPTLQHRSDPHDAINPTGAVCHHLAIFAPHLHQPIRAKRLLKPAWCHQKVSEAPAAGGWHRHNTTVTGSELLLVSAVCMEAHFGGGMLPNDLGWNEF